MTILVAPRVDAAAEAHVSPWIGFLLNQAAGRIRTATAAALEPFGLTPPQLRVLETIAAEQPLSQTRLGERVGMDRTTIVAVVDRFERLGVARRTVDPRDRRAHALEMTRAGDRVLAEAQAHARAAQDGFLAPLSAREQATLFALLSKLHPAPPKDCS